jgi:hypothetical protein
MLCAGVDCDDVNECTEDACDPMDGSCGYANVTDGMPCDFGGLPGVCAVGLCEDAMLCASVDCDDQNECTEDTCDPMDGSCGYANVTDGTPCDFGGVPGLCTAGVCVEDLCAGVDCDDGDACTTDSWDPNDGSCVNVNTCEDLDPPVLTAFDFDPKQVGVGDQVTCTMELTDAGVGVNQVLCSFESPSGSHALSCWANTYSSGDEFDGIWTCTTQPVPVGYEGGTYTALVRPEDNPDNLQLYNASQLQALGFPTELDVAYASPSWGTPQLIETDDAGDAGDVASNEFYAEVAVDPLGNATAVWPQSDGAHNNIWSNRYTPDGGWGTPVLIETNAGSVGRPQVAVDPQGNATAVWRQEDGARTAIWSNRYTPAGGWGTPVLLATDDASINPDGRRPQVAVDPRGYATAIWPQLDGGFLSIQTCRYTPEVGWGTPVLIANTEFSNETVGGPQVAVDPQGNVTIVWYQNFVGGRQGIWSNRYTPCDGWGTPVLINGAGGASASPQVAVDPQGNATAVWITHDNNPHFSIWSNRYTPADGWGTPVLIETDDVGTANSPQVAVDPQGNATAVWTQHDGVRLNTWSRRYTPTGGWGTPVLIDAGGAGHARLPRVAVDPQGNAIAIWHRQDVSRTNIWSNRYTPAGGWGTPVLLATDYVGGNIYPRVTLDPQGKATAVWPQSDGVRYNIRANRYE